MAILSMPISSTGGSRGQRHRVSTGFTLLFWSGCEITKVETALWNKLRTLNSQKNTERNRQKERKDCERGYLEETGALQQYFSAWKLGTPKIPSWVWSMHFKKPLSLHRLRCSVRKENTGLLGSQEAPNLFWCIITAIPVSRHYQQRQLKGATKNKQTNRKNKEGLGPGHYVSFSLCLPHYLQQTIKMATNELQYITYRKKQIQGNLKHLKTGN